MIADIRCAPAARRLMAVSSAIAPRGQACEAVRTILCESQPGKRGLDRDHVGRDTLLKR